MKGLTFGQVQDLIYNTCRAIDIRGVALKSNSEWQCVSAIVRLTHRSTEKVKEDQKILKEKLGEVGSENAMVFFDSLPISELQQLLTGIKEEHITIAGNDFVLKSKRDDLLSEKVFEYADLSQNEPDMEYPHYDVMVLSEVAPIIRTG